MLAKWVLLWSMLLGAAFALEIHDISQDWRAEVIQKELAPFQGAGLSKSEIENYNEGSEYESIFRFKIKNGQLTVSKISYLRACLLDDESMSLASKFIAARVKEYTKAINRLLATKPLPDMTLLIDCADLPSREDEKDIPIFTFSKNSNQKRDVLIPDFDLLGCSYHLYNQMLIDSSRFSWHNKLPIAFWRGSTTGGEKSIGFKWNIPSWMHFPRARVVVQSMANKLVLNARFTNYCQGAELNPDFLQVMGAPAPHVQIADHLQFKYLIDVDGNANTYPRYFWILLSNSMPLKVTSDFKQWYYDGLEPYKHYVPVAPDVSDIVEKIHWAIANDDAAYYIAMESQQFAMQYLHEDSIYSYLYHLLLAYSELFEE